MRSLGANQRPSGLTTQDSGAKTGGRGSATIEARYPVSAHARGHNLEFRAPVQRRHIQGVGTTSSGRALRKTGVPRRSYSTASSYSSSSSSMLVVESDRSKGDDSNEATSDVPIAVLDVNDTRPSDLLRGRRVL